MRRIKVKFNNFFRFSPPFLFCTNYTQNQYKLFLIKFFMRPAHQYLSPNPYTSKRQNRPNDFPRSPEFKTHLNTYVSPMNGYQNHSNNVHQKFPYQLNKTKPAFLQKRINQNQSKQGQSSQRIQGKVNGNDSMQMNGNQDLRITCPNVLSKVQFAALRNTTHGNNLAKFTETESTRDGKKSDIVHDNWDMRKKGIGQLSYSYNSQIKKPAFSKNSSQHTKQTQLGFQKTCGPKTLNEIWKKNREFANLKKEEVSTSLDESCEVEVPKLDRSKIVNGFYKIKQLGMGKFGEVYLAKHMETGYLVALKKMLKQKITQYKMQNQFKQQIKLHNSLDHPNIVKFYGFFQHGNSIYLILQYIQDGTLFDNLNEKQSLSPKEAASYVKCTLEAMVYLHDKSIAHRDIKPQNIVIASEGVSKLCDFGWSALVQSSRKTYCGTFDYVPPEVLEQKSYDTSVDIWCIGVLTYELLTGRVPFQGQKKQQIMNKIISVDKRKINYPIPIPEDAKDFIQLIVQKDPKLRPKCRDLLKHPFIVENTNMSKK